MAQYATWRARFEGMRGSRAAAGIANAKLYRGGDDILVILADIPGFRDALARAEGGWRTAIPADEVEGPPVVYFGADPGQEAAEGRAAFDASQAPLKLMAHFRVYDYAKWHEFFLKMENSRVGGGMTNPSIFRGSEDGNDLLVLGDVADPAKFRAWLTEDFMTGYPAARMRQIAGELYVSHNTVRTHVSHLYAKLGTRTRAEAVARARALGLLAPSPLGGKATRAG